MSVQHMMNKYIKTVRNRQKMFSFTTGDTPPFNPKILNWRVCRIHDVITNNKFHRNRLMGFPDTEVRKLESLTDFACRPYNSPALPYWLWWVYPPTNALHDVWQINSLIVYSYHFYHTCSVPTQFQLGYVCPHYCLCLTTNLLILWCLVSECTTCC